MRNSKSATQLNSKNSHVVTSWCHEWLVEEFNQREEEVGASLQTRFSVAVVDNKNTKADTTWRLKLYPKGCDQEYSKYVSIFLNQVSGPAVWVKYAISIMGCQTFDRSPYVYNTRRGAIQFIIDPLTSKTSSRGWKKFISHETIKSGSLLHDGGLLIRCVIEVESRVNSGADSSSQLATVESCGSQNFMDKMCYTDFAIKVEEQTYKCHKFMLAQKSNVFDAMFSHGNFNESQENEVKIEDLPAETVLEMLRFMYTGKVRCLKKVAQSLFAAADKYNIRDLKEVCEKSMTDSMSVDNVCSLLLLGHDHASTFLKEKALDFIANNVSAVTRSDGWKDVSALPGLMTDVVRAIDERR